MTRLNGLAITSGTAISLGVSGLDEIYLESKKKKNYIKVTSTKSAKSHCFLTKR